MAIQYTLYTTSTKRPYKRQAHFILAFLWYVRLPSLIFQGRARFPWQLYLYYPAPAIVFNISLFSALIFWFGWRCPRQSAADRLITESADFLLFYIVRCYPVATFCAGALIVFYCYCCRIGQTKTKKTRDRVEYVYLTNIRNAREQAVTGFGREYKSVNGRSWSYIGLESWRNIGGGRTAV